jgi:hypothetical protein
MLETEIALMRHEPKACTRFRIFPAWIREDLKKEERRSTRAKASCIAHGVASREEEASLFV